MIDGCQSRRIVAREVSKGTIRAASLSALSTMIRHDSETMRQHNIGVGQEAVKAAAKYTLGRSRRHSLIQGCMTGFTRLCGEWLCNRTQISGCLFSSAHAQC
jgi:hypothetical protein